MSLIGAAFIGLGFGLKHALEADHIAAVCALVTRDGGVLRAAKSGAIWGTGHGAVIVIAGGALVATGASVPGPLAVALDAVVAVMLVVLGIAALRGARAGHTHGRVRVKGERSKPNLLHMHWHSTGPLSAPIGRPLLVGLIHGASGTAALTLLVASSFHVRSDALAFVVLFGAASVLGMAIAAALLAWPLQKAARHAPDFARMLRSAAGVASIATGFAVFVAAITPGSVS
jgi:hypothetical protein